MTVTIEPPRTLTGDPVRQLQDLQSYLHRTAQQLQWAFDTLEGSSAPGASGVPAAQPREKSPGQVFGEIKNLIIKSADIVEAYEARITRKLEGIYTAKSEFGDYRRETEQVLQQDSQKLEQLFASRETLTSAVEGLQDRAETADAYIRTGLLGRDSQGTAVYGLEIGQRNQADGETVFDRFARFTANRLSFFDSADVEVAYISDYKLCITNAEISGNLRLGGRFRIYSSRGLIFQWMGGDPA